MTGALQDTSTINEHETEQVERANASGLMPVAFVHGLWLLPSSWDRWAAVFEEAGYATLTPGWPDDPETVEEAKAHPEVFAHKSVGQIADYVEGIIRRLDKKPAVIGHSFGGLLTQIIAGRGLAAVSVAIDPAPFRGVLPTATVPSRSRTSSSATALRTRSTSRRRKSSSRRMPFRALACRSSKPRRRI